MARNCPDCQQPLMQETYHAVDVDRCAECAGIWFDAGEVRRLLTTDPLALIALEEKITPQLPITQHKAAKSVFGCPSCDDLLHIYHYEYDSPIELNACDGCGGFWVQEGELLKMQQWHETHRHADSEEARRLAMAHAGIEHDAALRQSEGMRAFFGLLRQHKPLWWGNRG